MKNKLIDLNDHLFAQLERLTDESLDTKTLNFEIQRAKAVASVAIGIVNNARLALEARIAIHERMITDPPKMLGMEGYEEET